MIKTEQREQLNFQTRRRQRTKTIKNQLALPENMYVFHNANPNKRENHYQKFFRRFFSLGVTAYSVDLISQARRAPKRQTAEPETMILPS